MEKWNGHLYNWYDTVTLRTLKPLYVSTVDSGNFIGCLMAVEEGLKEYLKKPVIDFALAQGIKDTIEVLRECEGESRLLADTYLLDGFMDERSIDAVSWNSFLVKLEKALSSSHVKNHEGWAEKLLETVRALMRELNEIIPASVFDVNRKPGEENSGDGYHYANAADHSVNGDNGHENSDSGNIPYPVNQGTDGKLQQDRDVCYEITARLAEAINRDSSPLALRQEYLHAVSELDRVMSEEGINPVLYDRLSKLKQEILDAQERTTELIERCHGLAERIRVLCNDIKFAPLYDPKRQLFYYDLLASEARQASFIAIARGEVNQKHWFRLGRTLVMIDRFKGLVSWTGTMFEYLLPLLLMKSYENTLLDETYKFVVKNQKKYGRQRNMPWGISESAYNAFDLNLPRMLPYWPWPWIPRRLPRMFTG